MVQTSSAAPRFPAKLIGSGQSARAGRYLCAPGPGLQEELGEEGQKDAQGLIIPSRLEQQPAVAPMPRRRKKLSSQPTPLQCRLIACSVAALLLLLPAMLYCVTISYSGGSLPFAKLKLGASHFFAMTNQYEKAYYSAHYYGCASADRRVNEHIVDSDSRALVLQIPSQRHGYVGLRYLSLIAERHLDTNRRSHLDGIWFVGRSGTYWAETGFATWLVSPANPTGHRIVDDWSVSHNLVIKSQGPQFHAFGGQYFPSSLDRHIPKSLRAPDGVKDPRDGVHHLVARNFESIQQGCWLKPNHTRPGIMLGSHKGCVTARYDDGLCEFDGKLGVVFVKNTWYIFIRANVKKNGGRFVQMTRSKTGAAGPYDPLQLIKIDQYDTYGRGNIYFAAVDVSPIDAGMMVALMPVNAGTNASHNGNGESYIALTMSCDGVHWSALTKLVSSVGIDGRTEDQPVDGLIVHAGQAYFFVHEHVPHISKCKKMSRIVQYRLRMDTLRLLSREAKATLGGC